MKKLDICATCADKTSDCSSEIPETCPVIRGVEEVFEELTEEQQRNIYDEVEFSR